MKTLLAFFNTMLLLAVMIAFSTCDDEKEKPGISSVNPSTGREGDVVTITGAALGGTVKIKFGSIDAIPIDPRASEVTTQVPPGLSPGEVKVTVETDGGTTNAVTFMVIPPIPEITSISPDKAAAGMTVAITGTAFGTAKEVSLGSKKVSTFASKSDTEVKLVIPAGVELGGVDISITTDGGTSENVSYTIVGVPAIESFSPLAGPATTHVFLTGLHLEETSKVFFGDVEAAFEIQDPTLIDAVVPAGAATGPIKVITPGGEGLSTTDFMVIGAPTITSFSPSSGGIGADVTINGTNFNAPQLKVFFGGIEASTIQSSTSSQIVVDVPVGAASGKIKVETAAGSVTSGSNFTVVGAPTVTTFSPTSGVTGTSVVINGTNFQNVQSVKFNETAVPGADYTVNSSTKITAKVPAGTTNGVLTVTSAAGTGTSSTTFTIIGAPTISSISPVTGTIGSSVVINGTSFNSVTSVKFNGTAATYTKNSDTKITATVPAGATTGKISVTNPAGTASSSQTFTVLLAPTISTITPTSGLPGATLTINGSNLSFTNTTGKVKFNSLEVTSVVSNTGTQIKVVVPSTLSPGAVTVSVVTPGGTSNTKTFTVTSPPDAPVIADLKPAQSYKGFPIMIRGSKLKSATSVKVGTVSAQILTNYDASMIIMIPASTSNGSHSVTVTTAAGTSNAATLTIVTAPAGVGSPPSASFVSPPPANYVNVVSNQWSAFLLSQGFGDECELIDLNDESFCGSYTFTKDGSGKVTANYVEFCRGEGADEECYVGQWSATSPDPCVQKLVFISLKDGHTFSATVDVTDFDLYGTGSCSN
jgi:large repetitive protein